MSTQLGTPVAQPPTDGITRVRWSPSGSRLLATSWDQVRLHGLHGHTWDTSISSSSVDVLQLPCLSPILLLFCHRLCGCTTRQACSSAAACCQRPYWTAACKTTQPALQGSSTGPSQGDWPAHGCCCPVTITAQLQCVMMLSQHCHGGRSWMARIWES